MKTIALASLLSCFFIAKQETASAQTESVPFTAISSTKPTFASVYTETASVSDFNCTVSNNKVLLNWTVFSNEMADRLIVQRSKDGKKFQMVGLVFGTDKAGMDSYQFYEKFKTRKPAFYRIIIIHKDQSIEYSAILRNGKKPKKS